MGETRLNMVSARCCGCCALVWMAIAAVLVAIGIGTDFWYTGIYKGKYTSSGGDDNTFYLASTWGLEKSCTYPKEFPITSNVGDIKEPKSKDIIETKNWSCSKWKKDKSGGNFEDCKKAVDASLGFGILGLLGTAPFAAICLLFFCCPHKICCATFIHWIMIGLGFAIGVCWLISIGVAAGQCEKANKDIKTMMISRVTDTFPTGSTNQSTDSTGPVAFWSMILVILGLIFSLISTCVYWRFKCVHDSEANDIDKAQKTAENMPDNTPSMQAQA